MKNSKFKHWLSVISNNWFMLKYVFKHSPKVVILRFFAAILEIIVTYISINLSKWIFDGIEFGNVKSVLLLIAFWGMSCILINLYSSFCGVLYYPLKKIVVSKEIFLDYIYKSAKIDQINFQNTEFYNLYSRGLSEINERAYNVLNTFCMLFSAIVQSIVITTEVSNLNSKFALIGIVSASICVYITTIRNKINYQEDKENTQNAREREYIRRISYIPEFTSDIKLHANLIDLLKIHFSNSTEKYSKTFKKYAIKKIILDQLVSIVNVLSMTVIPWIIIIEQLHENTISLGEATLLINAANILPNRFSSIFNVFGQFVNHSLYIENLRKILSHKENIEKDSGTTFESSKFDIVVNDLKFRYGDGKSYAIQNLKLTINSGEKIAIVGFNGAGKSTFIKLLMRLYDPEEGSILINEKSIKDYNVKSLRENIGILTQDYHIYNFSIAENILLKPIENDEDICVVNEALKKVGLYDKISKWENGIRTCISKEFDEQGEYLSGGEKQKLALARIYAANYKCIILDEPTSALDPISEQEFIENALKIFKDKTLIVISHKLSLVKNFPRICFMAEGNVIEEGKHEELLIKNGHYCDFYSAQFNSNNNING